MHKAVVTALGHISERWRKELEQPSSVSGIATGNVEMHGHTNAELSNAEMNAKPHGIQSNGAGEHEQDRRANIASSQ
jgi:hypothetical protein